MKRIIALLLCVGMFAAVAAGCGGGQQLTATGDEATKADRRKARQTLYRPAHQGYHN